MSLVFMICFSYKNYREVILLSRGLELAKISMKIMGIRGFEPITSVSRKWVNWVTNFGLYTCYYCANQNGKIFDANNPPEDIPVHENCRCIVEEMRTIKIGTATIDGSRGADNWLYLYKTLSDNYFTKEQAKSAGWSEWKGNLQKILSGAIIGGNIYKNFKKKLPMNVGRIWYEADINYTGGYRNGHRLLFSNDGLMFVTFDHYETFYELV